MTHRMAHAGLRRPIALTGALTATALLAACSVGSSTGTSSQGTAAASTTVVVATHDSWAMSKQVLRRFTRQTGYTVRIEPNGDAGQLTNKLVLTRSSPIADATYGIDNTFASRAVDAGVLTPYTPAALPASAASYALPTEADAARLTPVDYGDVCVNVDDAWFRSHQLAEPRTLEDLTEARYKNLFVTPGAATSSPGLAFLLATVAKYGAGWPGYWKRLMANGAKLTAGWSDAWEVDYTAGGGKGSRPIVLSYASSIPDTIPRSGGAPTTHALLDTCFRQVEYAGVLVGARNSAGAKAFVDFMVQRAFQQELPGQMYVYPVDRSVPLPASWATYAKVAPHPLAVAPAQVARHRDAWLREWSDVTSS